MSSAFIHPTKRYRLYFDETGTGDLKAHQKDQNQRYLSLTGLVFRQDVHDTTFAIRLSALKRRIFRTPDVVLHRREIMGRQGIFTVLENDTVRADFDAQFANLVGYLPGPAFTVSIDKQAHLEKYKVWQFDTYHYVLTFWWNALSCGSTDMASSETLWAKPEDPNTTPDYGWHTVVCINLEAILLIKGWYRQS